MPRGDRTGPDGMGPRTGRAQGYCANPIPPQYAATPQLNDDDVKQEQIPMISQTEPLGRQCRTRRMSYGYGRGGYRGGDERGGYRGGDERGGYRGGDERGGYRGGDERGGYGGRGRCGRRGWCGGHK